MGRQNAGASSMDKLAAGDLGMPSSRAGESYSRGGSPSKGGGKVRKGGGKLKGKQAVPPSPPPPNVEFFAGGPRDSRLPLRPRPVESNAPMHWNNMPGNGLKEPGRLRGEPAHSIQENWGPQGPEPLDFMGFPGQRNFLDGPGPHGLPRLHGLAKPPNQFWHERDGDAFPLGPRVMPSGPAPPHLHPGDDWRPHHVQRGGGHPDSPPWAMENPRFLDEQAAWRDMQVDRLVEQQLAAHELDEVFKARRHHLQRQEQQNLIRHRANAAAALHQQEIPDVGPDEQLYSQAAVRQLATLLQQQRFLGGSPPLDDYSFGEMVGHGPPPPHFGGDAVAMVQDMWHQQRGRGGPSMESHLFNKGMKREGAERPQSLSPRSVQDFPDPAIGYRRAPSPQGIYERGLWRPLEAVVNGKDSRESHDAAVRSKMEASAQSSSMPGKDSCDGENGMVLPSQDEMDFFLSSVQYVR